MQSIVDVAIVGGGVIGCAIAYYLSKSGVDVAVFDRGEIGAEASSAATGLLAPLGLLSGPGPFADLLLSSFALFPTLVPELEEASGINLEYEHTGASRCHDPRSVSPADHTSGTPDVSSIGSLIKPDWSFPGSDSFLP